MRVTLALVLSALAVSACREKPAAPPVTPSATATAVSIPSATNAVPPVTPPPSSDSPFACSTNADCTNSCRHGAVNLRWWQGKYPGEEACEDGCTSKGTDPARCESGKCVAYAFGKPSKECTELTRDVVAGPGPAHRCGSAADCMLSCRYGAINRNWYRLAQRNECKDGCAGDGAEEPRCDKGTCTAYNRGLPNTSCTQRSTHDTKD